MLRDWKEFIEDLLQHCTRVIQYSDSIDFFQFREHGMAFDAIVRKLELIAEAASHVPQEIRERYPKIPWRQIIGLRNTLIHGYFSVTMD